MSEIFNLLYKDYESDLQDLESLSAPQSLREYLKGNLLDRFSTLILSQTRLSQIERDLETNDFVTRYILLLGKLQSAGFTKVEAERILSIEISEKKGKLNEADDG